MQPSSVKWIFSFFNISQWSFKRMWINNITIQQVIKVGLKEISWLPQVIQVNDTGSASGGEWQKFSDCQASTCASMTLYAVLNFLCTRFLSKAARLWLFLPWAPFTTRESNLGGVAGNVSPDVLLAVVSQISVKWKTQTSTSITMRRSKRTWVFHRAGD